MSRQKGLGRGLDALLGAGSGARSEDELTSLPVDSLRPGKYQPRTRMDEASLQDLAESIRARGVIQPIVVRPLNDSHYEILAGERRWRAARLANLERIPAVVREVPDEAALGIGLIENIQREDLNPIEEASGLKRLIDEFKLTHQEAARAVGRSRVGVTNMLRLLELAPAVQVMVLEGRIDMGHARALLALGKARQVELAEGRTPELRQARPRQPPAAGRPVRIARGDREAQAPPRRPRLGGDRVFEPRRTAGIAEEIEARVRRAAQAVGAPTL